MSDYIDIRSELCKSCIHTNVCRKDKNLAGDVFVMGHPSFFDNDELFRKFKEREAAGFPCDDYMQERKHGKWIDYKCSNCGYSAVIRVEHDGDVVWESTPMNFCPNCGADMRGES